MKELYFIILSRRKSSFHAKFQVHCLHGLPEYKSHKPHLPYTPRICTIILISARISYLLLIDIKLPFGTTIAVLFGEFNNFKLKKQLYSCDVSSY